MKESTILCVDDERNVLRALERIFLDDDYTILSACSAEEGLRLLETTPEVQVVISDYRMPGMNGVEFLKEVFRLYPQSVRLVLSGYADTAAVVAAINEGKIYQFIPKPWCDEEVRKTVETALETYRMQRTNVLLNEKLQQRNEELTMVNARLQRQVQERTKELRRQSEALKLLDHLPVGVVGTTAEGVVLQINREAAQMLGVDPEEVMGKSVAAALPLQFRILPDGVGDCDCGCRKVEVDGVPLQIKGSMIGRDGESMLVLAITGEAPEAGPGGGEPA